MSRYINADGLLEALNGFNDKRHGNNHFINGIKTAIELVENYAVDGEVEKVRRGQYEDTTINITLLTQKCSVCKERGAIGDYCMWCGARMRGGDNK